MTTQSIRFSQARSLPLSLAPSAALAGVTLIGAVLFAGALLEAPNQNWILATALATVAMIGSTLYLFRGCSPRVALAMTLAQATLLSAAPVLAWLHELRDPGGLGLVLSAGHHRIYSGMPLHFDIPMGVLLGLAPLHLLSLARAIDPGPRRRWLFAPFLLAGLTTLLAAATPTLSLHGAASDLSRLTFLLTVLGVLATRLASVVCGVALFASLARRPGKRLQAALAVPVTATLVLTVLVAPLYRFRFENLGYRPLSVALVVISGIALATLWAARHSLSRLAHPERHLRRLAEEQMALERDALAGATNAQNT